VYKKSAELVTTSGDRLEDFVHKVTTESEVVAGEVSEVAQNAAHLSSDVLEWGALWVKLICAAKALQVLAQFRIVRWMIRYLKIFLMRFFRCCYRTRCCCRRYLDRSEASNSAGDGPSVSSALEDIPGDMMVEQESEYSESEFDDWPVVCAQGSKDSDWQEFVGKTIAFRYARGRTPGKLRAIDVSKAKKNRLYGAYTGPPPPEGGHVKEALTYYTHFMSDIRMCPLDAGPVTVAVVDLPPPPLPPPAGLPPRRSGTSGAGRSRSLAVPKSKSAAKARAKSVSRTVRVVEPRERTRNGMQSDPDSRSAGSHATIGRASNLVVSVAAAMPLVVTRTVECYSLPHFVDNSVLQLAFRSGVEELVNSVVPFCQKFLWIACYVYEGFYNTAIEQRARADVACKMVVDRNKLFQVGKGLRMQEALLGLLEWNVEIRHSLPGYGNMLSAQHQKSWLIDGGMLLYGSHNLSKNSARNCDELLSATCVKSACDDFASHFEWLWDRSLAVEKQELRSLIAQHHAKKEEKAEERSLEMQRLSLLYPNS